MIVDPSRAISFELIELVNINLELKQSVQLQSHPLHMLHCKRRDRKLELSLHSVYERE